MDEMGITWRDETVTTRGYGVLTYAVRDRWALCPPVTVNGNMKRTEFTFHQHRDPDNARPAREPAAR